MKFEFQRLQIEFHQKTHFYPQPSRDCMDGKGYHQDFLQNESTGPLFKKVVKGLP